MDINTEILNTIKNLQNEISELKLKQTESNEIIKDLTSYNHLNKLKNKFNYHTKRINSLLETCMGCYDKEEDLKIGVCIRAKDEQNIISDWTRHYLNLGFDRIIIYDNLSEPSIYNTLNNNNLINEKVIINIDTKKVTNQLGCYEDAVNNNQDLDWLLLCDADEFLWLHDNEKSIKNFLSKFTQETSTIFINWLTYGTSGNKTYNKDKTIFEQFTQREDYEFTWNQMVKSFVRPKFCTEFQNVHAFVNIMCPYVKNVYNEDINIFWPETNMKCIYKDEKMSDSTPLLLVHYMTLDEESMLKKQDKQLRAKIIPHISGTNDEKYSLEWYHREHNWSDLSSRGGFKDNNNDIRMFKYIK